MRIVTDSTPVEDPKQTDGSTVIALYKLFADDTAVNQMVTDHEAGGFGYGTVKKALADAADQYFAEARDKRQELASKPETVREILGDGARQARAKAGEVLQRAQQACGLKA